MDGDSIRFGNVHGPVQTGSGVQNTAGRDQNVAFGDQNVAGRDQTVLGGSREMLAELAGLRRALPELRLTPAERARAERELAAVEHAMRGREPDRGAAGRHLHAFTAGLKEAGALASAGTTVAESIGRIARWLGPVAAGVLSLLSL